MKTLSNFIAENTFTAEHAHRLISTIHGALNGRYETKSGKEVRGNTLDWVHSHLKDNGIHLPKRALESFLQDNARYKHGVHHEQGGTSLMGWTRKGMTKRTKASFYHANKEWVADDEDKKHIPSFPEYKTYHNK